MSVRVRIPTPLRTLTGGAAEVNVDGSSLGEAIARLETQYPGIEQRLKDENGELRRFVNLYVNGEDVRFLEGLDTSLKTGDEVSIVPAVASSILWIWIFNPTGGLLNNFLGAFGIHGPNWLQDEDTSKWALILMGLWGAGGGMIIWLAGLKNISESYYEAASLDGANTWQQFTNVTLPLMTPYIFFNLIMGLIGIILASVVNIFLGSSALQFAISVIGVLVFVGLTAFDTQRIKSDYIQHAYAEGTELAGKRTVMDALALYLNFINLFMMLLQLLGQRNE